MSKTKYDGKASDDWKNSAMVRGLEGQDGKERVHTIYSHNKSEWQKHVVSEVKEQINKQRLDKIQPGSECVLYVTFSLSKETHKKNWNESRDLDNLLKAFLDPLKKEYGHTRPKKPIPGKKPIQGAGFIEDDVCVKGVRAERVLADTPNECVKFRYLIVKTFKIIGFELIKEAQIEKYYSKNWKHPMYRIEANEIIGVGTENEREGKKSIFIDNEPGQHFGLGKYEKELLDVFPGYDWEKYKEKPVEGCLVFNRQPTNPVKKGEKFWWLKKWGI